MARTIHRHSGVPLYQQLYDILRQGIARGKWLPGDLIPAESELIAQYGVSRITVRQVLGRLAREGLIYRQRGRGSFVSHPTVEQGLSRIVSFTEDMRQRGFTPASRVLSAQLVPAPPEIAERLGIAAGEELALIRRLRLADDEPMSIEESYLVHRHCPGILSHADYASVSLRATLDRKFGIHIRRARQVIRAVAAAPELARRLSIPRRAPLIYVERVSFADQDQPVEYLRIYYRADRYELHGELHE